MIQGCRFCAISMRFLTETYLTVWTRLFAEPPEVLKVILHLSPAPSYSLRYSKCPTTHANRFLFLKVPSNLFFQIDRYRTVFTKYIGVLIYP